MNNKDKLKPGWHLGEKLNIALIVSTLVHSRLVVSRIAVAKGEMSIVISLSLMMRSQAAVTSNKSIVHRWPLLSPIFRVAYESRVEKTGHLLRLSTNRSNFLLLHKTGSAEDSRGKRAEVKRPRVQPHRKDRASGEEEDSVDFPSSPSSAIASRRSKFDLSSQPSALSALRDRSSAIAREDDICQSFHFQPEFQLKQSNIFLNVKTLIKTLERGEDRKDPPIMSSRNNYGPAEERHEPASRSYERLTFESTTTIRLAMPIVKYTVRYYSMILTSFISITDVIKLNLGCYYRENFWLPIPRSTCSYHAKLIVGDSWTILACHWRSESRPRKQGGHERSPILLTQAEHKSQVAQSLQASPRKSDVGLRVGARDLRSRIDLRLEIEDINQRSAALVHVGGRY
ncbi:hypothetical protein ALC53_11589 [Atta colombica]|uniref:Uncharacterized protein n=1 Tax=Atta colombica TaxID=520822 RepID=A0A195B0B7_9HYME|nr:hypothetical protein ALC53_11589 [Atta colombica]